MRVPCFLPRCLASIPVGTEIIVVDSKSTDETVAIAKSFGAVVYERPFTNYAEQKNYALSLATRDWVLSLDADEELSGEFLKAFAPVEGAKVLGYRISRSLVFMDRKLSFGKTKDAPLRLFKRDSGKFDGAIHAMVNQ